jgi:hypothetical protein
MPVCVRCGKDKSEFAFAWRWKWRGIRQKTCKACRKIENAEWYERHGEQHRARVKQRLKAARVAARAYVAAILGQSRCVYCGESDSKVLEFHHVKRKRNSVSKLAAGGASPERIQREIDRCEVVCANCHRRLHWR